MRILVVSDTHRKNENYLRVLEKEGAFDAIIHCGDVEGAEYLIAESAQCPSYIVMGNNDFFSELSPEIEIELEGFHVLITHGHSYYISMGNEMLKEEAKARGFDLVFYGHTHRPVIDKEDGIIAVNPGSLTYPRQEGKKPTYIVMELERGRTPDIQLRYLEI